jgi:hypothetical protein
VGFLAFLACTIAFGYLGTLVIAAPLKLALFRLYERRLVKRLGRLHHESENNLVNGLREAGRCIGTNLALPFRLIHILVWLLGAIASWALFLA